MKVLLVGTGVIGTVYGTQLAKAGHTVEVLAHGTRSEQVAIEGLRSADMITGDSQEVPVRVVSDGSVTAYDLVLVAVWAGQISSVFQRLGALAGSPVVLLFGNNPRGDRGVSGAPPGTARLGFPGIGGTLHSGTVEYVKIPRQPTILEVGGGAPVAAFEASLARSRFRVARTPEMAGWLAYHAVFVGSVAAALRRSHGSATELAANLPLLDLMCRSIEEGFRALDRQGVRGMPRNLRTLHRPALRPLARWYWARTMRSPMGERCFAAHARHAKPEMRILEADAVERVGDDPQAGHLRRLLTPG